MKIFLARFRNVIMIVGMSLSFEGINAQSWNTAGNATATSSSKLGTTNAIPLRFFTNNSERLHITSSGNIGIGTTTPLNVFSVQLNGTVPASSWLSGGGSLPTFLGFGEGQTTGFNLSTAANSPGYRPVLNTRRSRGTLAAPKAVRNNDYLASFVSSGYDGSAFQNPAGIDFYVDGTPTSGNVPARISFVTGSKAGNRAERLKIGSTGNFDFNNGQLFLDQLNGLLGIGTITPLFSLDVRSTNAFGQFKATGGWAAVITDKSDATQNEYLIHRTAGVDTWTEGTIGNNNFSLHNWHSGADAITIDNSNDYIGMGTSTPGTRLVVANDKINGPTALIQNLFSSSGFSDGLFIQAGNNYGTSTSYYVGFKRPDGIIIGSVLQADENSVTYATISDKRLKTNIHETKFGLADVKKIWVKDYNFINGKNEQTGFIAQQLYEIFPEAVAMGGEDPKSRPWMVDYGRVTPLLVKAIQELSARNDEKDTAIATLQQQISDLAADVKNMKLAILNGGVNTSAKLASGYLKQNVPNPYSNNTIVSYYIPGNIEHAEIRINDSKGSVVKIYDVSKGESQLIIKNGDLPKGVYNYSLYANGKAVETRQMIIIK